MEIQSLAGSLAATQINSFYNKSNDVTEEGKDGATTTSTGMDTVTISDEARAMSAAYQDQSSQEQTSEQGMAGGAGGGGSGSEDDSESESIKNKITTLQTQLAQLTNTPQDMAKAAAISSQIAALTAQLNAVEEG